MVRADQADRHHGALYRLSDTPGCSAATRAGRPPIPSRPGQVETGCPPGAPVSCAWPSAAEDQPPPLLHLEIVIARPCAAPRVDQRPATIGCAAPLVPGNNRMAVAALPSAVCGGRCKFEKPERRIALSPGRAEVQWHDGSLRSLQLNACYSRGRNIIVSIHDQVTLRLRCRWAWKARTARAGRVSAAAAASRPLKKDYILSCRAPALTSWSLVPVAVGVVPTHL